MSKRKEHIPTRMPTANRPANDGVSLDDDTSRLDSVAKVTGSAKYSRDTYLPDSLFVAFIRCPWGAGELESRDESAALTVPGVLEVNIDSDRGRYHGHPVGHLVAESRHAVERGLKALNPRWSRDPVTTQITDAMEEAPAPSDETRAILERADHVLEATYSTRVQTHSAFETHGAVVDHRGDSATVFASTQGTFSVRDGVGEVIGLPTSAYEVKCEYIGGGFGSKLSAGKEAQLASRVAAKYKRPVYLFIGRDEEQVDTGNRPSSRTNVRIGFTNDGTVLGGQIHCWGGVGVASRGGGVGCPSNLYDLGAIQKTHADVSFNGCPPRPMRAPGRPQGVFTEAMMLDDIAFIAGVDPLELRMRLDVDDDRREMYETGAKLIGWDQRLPTGAQKSVIRRGMGVAAGDWPRYPAIAEAELVINRDGSVEARTGTQDIGTGQRTVMGIVAADTLGIPLEYVSVRIGSSTLPIGPASGGSMTAHNTAPAMTDAAAEAREKLLTMLAEREAGDASEFTITDGAILRNDKPYLTWQEACRRITGEGIVGRGRWEPAMARTDPTRGHSYAVQFVDLTVDTETGVIRVDHVVAVQSCGKVVCRKTAENQVIGGVIQGLSYALWEDRILDRNTGAMVNPNLEMYKILGARDMPHIEPVFYTKGQTGVRSLGEPPTIPTSGATACAVFNALGAPVRNLPITPDKVLRALEGGAA